MIISDLIKQLQAMPQYADVLFEDGEEYRDIEVELGDVHDDAALVIIRVAPESKL